MTDEQVMAGAVWLGADVHSVPWSELTTDRREKLLRWSRGILTAAEIAARTQPVALPRPLDVEAMWKAVREASSS
jgi:hypothetical protein